jgi:hypothetical protein
LFIALLTYSIQDSSTGSKRIRSLAATGRTNRSYYMVDPENLPGTQAVGAAYKVYEKIRDILAPAVKAEKLKNVSDVDNVLDELLTSYHTVTLDIEIYDSLVKELHCILGLTPDRASDDAVKSLGDSEAKTELERIRRENPKRQLLHKKGVDKKALKEKHAVEPSPLPNIFEPGYHATKEYLDWEYYHILLIAAPILEWRKATALTKRDSKMWKKFHDDQKAFSDKVKNLRTLYASNDLPVPKDLPDIVAKMDDLFAYNFNDTVEESSAA